MALREILLPWQSQPQEVVRLGSLLPAPLAVFRPVGDRHAPGAFGSSTYSGITAGITQAGTSLAVAGGSSDGILHTVDTEYDRNTYAVAGVFRVDSSTTSTLIGLRSLQVRVETDGKIGVLNEGNAYLAGSSLALGVGAVATVVVASSATLGLVVYVNGSLWVSSSAFDIGSSGSFGNAIRFGRRSASGETLTGHVIEAALWSGWEAGDPELRALSGNYFGSIFAPQEVGIWMPSAGGIAAPTLVSASAINIGSTYATPRVTFSR